MKGTHKILSESGCPPIPFDEKVTMFYSAICSAMEEFAEEISVDFKDWCDKNAINFDFQEETNHSNKEYFEKYIKSKQK